MFYPSVCLTGYLYGHVLQLRALLLWRTGQSAAGSPVELGVAHPTHVDKLFSGLARVK